MVKKTITPEKTLIDPRFDIPEGLDSFVHQDDSDYDSSESEAILEPAETDVVQASAVDTSGVILNDTSNVLPVPSNITILGQTVRSSPDGRQVIDVEIWVDDIEGVNKIEVRKA